MATHPGMLLAYDATGDVVATLDYLVQYDAAGVPLGLVDFAVHEDAGGEHADIWRADRAVGSKAWPEYLGSRAHEFRVELVGPPGRKRIAALIHKASGHRRERASVEASIAERIAQATGPADIRDVVGGPDRPLALDAEGRTAPRVIRERPTLPLVSVR